MRIIEGRWSRISGMSCCHCLSMGLLLLLLRLLEQFQVVFAPNLLLMYRQLIPLVGHHERELVALQVWILCLHTLVHESMENQVRWLLLMHVGRAPELGLELFVDLRILLLGRMSFILDIHLASIRH